MPPHSVQLAPLAPLLLLGAPPLAFAGWVAALNALGAARLRPLLRVRQSYNRALAAYSAFGFARGVQIMAQDGRLSSCRAVLCEASHRWPELWLASKFFEWFDTAFIVAAGREPSSLHLLHHALTPVMVLLDLALAESPSPLFLVATTLNLGTHAFMYTYFSDPTGWRAWRPLVQRLQVGQHATMTCLIFAALCLPAAAGAPVDGCEVPAGRYGVGLVFFAWMLRSFLTIFNAAPARAKAD